MGNAITEFSISPEVNLYSKSLELRTHLRPSRPKDGRSALKDSLRIARTRCA